MRRLTPLLFIALVTVTACAETPRTGTNFCRQLAKEMPGISVMPATVEEVNAAVGHFTRLQKVAPLEVQQDWDALTELMIAASKVKADDAESVQKVADLAYATEANANAASEWVKATCGVDISLGVQVTP
ncbi:MAG: hypothetical protein RJB40_609 [Actinomycetota bacterium]